MKKKKEQFVDDGRSYADMNVPGMPGCRIQRSFKKGDKSSAYSNEEQKAIMKAAYKTAFKTLGIIVAGFGCAILLMCLWLL